MEMTMRDWDQVFWAIQSIRDRLKLELDLAYSQDALDLDRLTIHGLSSDACAVISRARRVESESQEVTGIIERVRTADDVREEDTYDSV